MVYYRLTMERCGSMFMRTYTPVRVLVVYYVLLHYNPPYTVIPSDRVLPRVSCIAHNKIM